MRAGIKKFVLPVVFLLTLLGNGCSSLQQPLAEPCHVQLKCMPGFEVSQLSEILSSYDVISVQWHLSPDAMGSNGVAVVEVTLRDKNKLTELRKALADNGLNLQSLNVYQGY